ncbi:Uma2 family endonuclease [Streptomyces sp. x-19]|uniref:Uma2 family endonuclease n=1 Tax=Streptomyces sp. x-19 TaxID=2789280 RepID=UPI00397EB52F
MSAAAVERPHVGKLPSLLEEAEKLTHLLPGHRVEILGGNLTVTPPADGSHAESLTNLTFAFAPAHQGQTRVAQAIGLWLPDGPEDYAVPDLAVVDADYRDHLIEANCYDPAIFRLVVEVTSSNYATDLRTKVAAYAVAKVPVYVIVDRRAERIHVLTDPFANEYNHHELHAAGQHVTLPDSIGAEVTLDVGAILEAARP